MEGCLQIPIKIQIKIAQRCPCTLNRFDGGIHSTSINLGKVLALALVLAPVHALMLTLALALALVHALMLTMALVLALALKSLAFFHLKKNLPIHIRFQ